MRAQWTPYEDAVLRALYAANRGQPLSLDEIASTIGRTRAAVAYRANELGITEPRRLMSVVDASGRRPSERRKYSTPEKLHAGRSLTAKEWLAEKGHPRGALGLKHTPETRAKIGAASRRSWMEMTPGVLQRRAAKQRATYLANGNVRLPTHGRGRGGRRPDIDNRYFRSSWEANWARYLRWCQVQGLISGWEYEPVTFVFHGVTRGPLTYTPDFRVTENNGDRYFHEVKGWMDTKSKGKLRRMKKFYPEVVVHLIQKPEYDAVRAYSGLIEGWE